MARQTRLAICLIALAACGDDNPKPQPDQLVLPGNAYYPESLNAADDGTLYVGSLATGEVVAFHDGATDPDVILAPGTAGVTGVTGVLVAGDALWLCSIDTTFQRPTELRRFDLAGTPQASYPLAPNQFCNDMAFDDAGNLYVADSFGGTIQRLAAGAQSLETFAQDASWTPAMQGAFALDGIAYDGHGHLYVGKLDTGKLFRVDTATAASTEIAVTPPLVAPDAVRIVDEHTLLTVQGGGQVVELALSGDTATATTVADGLDQPTSVVQARGTAWVSQGQLGRLFAQPSQPPVLPFLVRRVEL
jgi:streptogramin lyase